MRQSLIYMHIAVFLWGFTGVLGKAISIDEISLVWWRVFFVIVMLGIINTIGKKYLMRAWPELVEKNANNNSSVTIPFYQKYLPGFLLGVHWIFFYGSIKYANVSIALTCLSTGALMAAILEPVILKTKIRLIEISLGLIVLVAIFIIYQTHLNYLKGIIYGLLAALFTVLTSILSKKNIGFFNGLQLTNFNYIGAFTATCIALGVNYLQNGYWLQLPKDIWDVLWIFILSIVCSLFTFFLWIKALQHISAFTSNMLLTLEPVYGIILAFLIFKENKDISNFFYIGFLMIGIAVSLQTYYQKKQRI
jgi:drug/metabolite transporter (DMT)-like permease